MNLKLKRTPGLFLVGFMASGKSTAGRLLAQKLGWQFADIDADIERRQGISIRELFERHGEEFFRELEAQAIQECIQMIRGGHPWVVALGGGAFVQERNRELITNHGITLWLDCPINRIQLRLGGDTTRPLAANPDRLAALYEARQLLYARADFRIDADCDRPDEIVRRISELPIF